MKSREQCKIAGKALARGKEMQTYSSLVAVKQRECLEAKPARRGSKETRAGMAQHATDMRHE